MHFKVFLPEDEHCRECGGNGEIHSDRSAGNENIYPMEERECIGTIMSYHSGNCAASLLLDGALRCGDRIVVVEEEGEQEFEVEWMQWGKAWIHLALRGWMVTIPANGRLSAGAKVYRAA